MSQQQQPTAPSMNEADASIAPGTRFVLRLDNVAKEGSRPLDGAYFLRDYTERAADGEPHLEATGALNRAMTFETPLAAYQFLKTIKGMTFNAEVMSEDGALVCRRCLEFIDTGGVKEVYEYTPPDGFVESNATIYIDVEKAFKVIAESGRLPMYENNFANLLPHLEAHEIYEPHVAHVPPSAGKPGLLLRFLLTNPMSGDRSEHHVIADGNHRLAQDLVERRPFFFYDLGITESLLVSSTNLFMIAGETLVAEVAKFCESLNKTPAELFDEVTRDRDEAASLVMLEEEGATFSAVNRFNALACAAFVLNARTPGAPDRVCPEVLLHFDAITCRVCGFGGEAR